VGVRFYPTDRTKVVAARNYYPGWPLKYIFTQWRFAFLGDNGYSTLKYLLVIEVPFYVMSIGFYRKAPKCGVRNTL